MKVNVLDAKRRSSLVRFAPLVRRDSMPAVAVPANEQAALVMVAPELQAQEVERRRKEELRARKQQERALRRQRRMQQAVHRSD